MYGKIVLKRCFSAGHSHTWDLMIMLTSSLRAQGFHLWFCSNIVQWHARGSRQWS